MSVCVCLCVGVDVGVYNIVGIQNYNQKVFF